MHLDENLEKGILFILATFLTVSVMSALGKAVAPYASPITILLFQNSISFLIIIPLIIKKGIKATFATKRLFTHFFRALTGTMCWYCLFLAIKMIGLNTSVLLVYSAPLLMPIMGHFLFKEKSHPKVWLGVVIGFIGIAFVLHINSLKLFESFGVLIAIAGGLSLALAMFAVRWLSKTESPTTILSYYFLTSTIMVTPLAYFNFKMQGDFKVWLYLISIGIALALSQLLLIKAYQYASAIKLSPFIYSVIVFTAIINSIVWHDIPNLWQVSGIILVVIGGIFSMIAKTLKQQ